MKVIILLFAIGIIFASNFQLDDSFVKFSEFINKYKKVYSNVSEFLERFQIFQDNMKRVEAMQKVLSLKAGVPNEEQNLQLGITQFSDLSPQEFRARYLTLKKGNTSKMLRSDKLNEVYIPTNLEDTPESFDWRDKGAVTSIKNQGMCGSCWAFSAVGNIEGQLQIKTGKAVDLSPQQLVDCDRKVDQGCDGGDMNYAFDYLTEVGGIDTLADYPYDGDDEKCRYDPSKSVAKVIGYKYAGSTDEEVIKNFLYTTGPLAIGINAEPLQFYIFGIFNPWFEWICDPADQNHGVVLVGYGVHKGIFGDTPYWIVKNSWGWIWGERGYFRIIRGKGACGINVDVLSSILE